VIFGILFVSLMAAAGISIDFARIWVMRNELQTAADASALAGAVQYGNKPDNLDYQIDSASRNFAALNKAMGAAVVVDSVILGNWTDTPPNGVWTPLCRVVSGTCVAIGTPPSPVPPKNAVRTVVSHTTNGLIMSALGITAPNVHARATAWADAPVPTSNCIKPWSIPYAVLMQRINTHRGIANDFAGLTRPFDQNLDMQALREMTDAERSFTLKQGPDGANDPYPDGSTAPGNFQRIQLPKYKDAEDYSTPWPEGNSNGTPDYKDAISGSTCHTLGIGDSLATLTGNTPQPTLDAIVPGVCASLVNDEQSPNNGNCINAQGGVGVDIKAAFHQCLNNCNGMQFVEVKMLGAFTLTKVYPNKENGPNPSWETGEIQGTFKPVTAGGPIGPGPTLFTQIILVK
jgi:Flp pilus assembly protein TadG